VPQRCRLCADPLSVHDALPIWRGLRAELGYGQTDREELRATVEAVLPPRVYREIHAATVIEQRGDGTLDLQADDARIGGLSRVRSEEHTSELQSRENLVCRPLL